MISVREKLSLFWIFLFLNFIFCDVFTLFYAPMLNQLLIGVADGVEMGQPFLLGFSVLMEIGMVMVLVSRLAPYRINRWANAIIGVLLLAVQASTVISSGLTLHYAFFSAIEIATLAFIVWTAWRWRETG